MARSLEDTRDEYNGLAKYYDKISVALTPVQGFALFAQPGFADSILDLGAASGDMLGKLARRARTRQPSPHHASEPGAFVAVDLAENFEGSIRQHLRSAEPTLNISTCNAGAGGPRPTAVRMLIDQDNTEHARPLHRGEARLYLGLGANFMNPALMAHLAQKAPGGGGFDLITATHVLTHVPPAVHHQVLRQWATMLAPGGRLVVERSLYHPYPGRPLDLTCPGQLVFKVRTPDRSAVALSGHRQCAPDRFWDVCEQQMRQLAAQAGLNVTRLSWAGHGDAGAAMGGGFSNIWADEWEAELLAKMPEARDHDLVDLLCGKAEDFQRERPRVTMGHEHVHYNLVAVIAELKRQG